MTKNKIAYAKPAGIAEALSIAAKNEGAFRFLAGGTDLLVNQFQGTEATGCLIDLDGVKQLKETYEDEKFLHIGAFTTLEDIQRNARIISQFPVLAEAVKSVASPVIRKTATLGGNILCENRCTFFNQSDWWRKAVGYCLKCSGDTCIATGGDKNCFSKYSSDMGVALIALGAQVNLAGPLGNQTLNLEELYTGNGVNPRNISRNSIIISVQVPRDRGSRAIFKKLRQRESIDFTSLSTCVATDNSGNIRLVAGGVDPRPILIEGKRSDDKSDLIRKTVKKARTVDNDVYSRKYRKEVMHVFLKQSLEALGVR